MFSHLEPTSTCPSAPHKPFGWCSCLAPVHCKVLQGATNQRLKLDRPPAWWDASGLHLPPQRGPMHFHPEASWPLPSSYIGPPMSPRQNVQNGSGLVQSNCPRLGLAFQSDLSGPRPRRLVLEPAVTQSLLCCEAAFRFKVQEASHQRTSSFRFTLEELEFSKLSLKALLAFTL